MRSRQATDLQGADAVCTATDRLRPLFLWLTRPEGAAAASAVLALLYAAFSPLRDIYGIEARNALFARNMLEEGIHLVPRLYGQPYPDYPPLYFILEYIFSLPAGHISTLAAVLPSSIAAAVLCGATWRWSAIASRNLAAASLLVLAVAPGFWLKASHATIDMLLAAETFGAFFFFSRAYNFPEKHRNYLLAAFLLTAAAFFTKGPVGLIIPVGSWGAFLFTEGKWKELGRHGIRTALLFIIMLGCYYGSIYILEGPEQIKTIIASQVTERVGTSVNKPWHYYVLYIFSAFSPWWLLLAGLKWIIRGRMAKLCPVFHGEKSRDGGMMRTARGAVFKNSSQCDLLLRQSAAALAFIFTMFMLASSRHGRYLLPAFPFVAILTAAGINAVAARTVPGAWLFRGTEDELLTRMPFRIARRATCLTALTASLLLILNAVVLDPFLSRRESGRGFMETVYQKIPDNFNVLIYDINPDGDGLKLALYWPGKQTRLVFSRKLPACQEHQEPFVLISMKTRLKAIENLLPNTAYREVAVGLLHRKAVAALIINCQQDTGKSVRPGYASYPLRASTIAIQPAAAINTPETPNPALNIPISASQPVNQGNAPPPAT